MDGKTLIREVLERCGPLLESITKASDLSPVTATARMVVKRLGKDSRMFQVRFSVAQDGGLSLTLDSIGDIGASGITLSPGPRLSDGLSISESLRRRGLKSRSRRR